MTKQEAIKQAWGTRYDAMKIFSDCDENDLKYFLEEGRVYINHIPDHMRGHAYGEYMKNINGYAWPIELDNIKTNNNWIKIKSEADLPKEEGEYWIANDNGIFDFIASKFQIKNKFENKTCTHYQPIIKPKPPIY